MSTIVALSAQFTQYQQLAFHHDAELANQLNQLQQWQKDQMQQRHQVLFSTPSHQALAQFFLQHLYSLAQLTQLANQLQKVLDEKIKLERFLPDSISSALVSAFELACLTLTLDEQVALYLRQHQLPIESNAIEHSLQALQQYQPRLHQLALLQQLGATLQQTSRHFWMQSAFKLGKSTAYRREFHFLYDYLSNAFRAIRPSAPNNYFFRQLVQAEQRYLEGSLLPQPDDTMTALP
jgi:hypothetical protein